MGILGALNGAVGGPGHPLGIGEVPGANTYSNSQSVNYSGTVWGSIIPISAGYRAVTGVPIWAAEPVKTDIDTVTIPGPTPDLPGWTNTNWLWRRTFAIAVGKRLNPDDPATRVRRVWLDGQLAWSNGSSVPLSYNNLTKDYQPTGQWIDGVWVPLPGEEGGAPQFFGSNPPLGPAIESNITFRFYTGTEDQMPDPAIVAALDDLAPAFRGLMYLVIDGLVVGKGSQSNRPTAGPSAVQSGYDSAIPNKYPVVTVELADEDAVSSSIHDFLMKDGSPPFVNDNNILCNFDTREIAVLTVVNAGGGTLHFFDMDTHAETSFVHVTSADRVGASFSAWDKLNDVIFTASVSTGAGPGQAYMSIARDGTIISLGPTATSGSILNAMGGTPTDANPATQFPTPTESAVGYILKTAQFQTVLVTGGTFSTLTFMAPDSDGTLPTEVYPRSFTDNSPHTVNNMTFFRLWERALTAGNVYQDAAMVLAKGQSGAKSTPDEVEVLYFGVETAPNGKPAIVLRGRKHVYTANDVNDTVCVLIDNNGHILVQDTDGSTGVVTLTRFVVSYGAPDFTIAPGFQGIFPKVGAVSLDHFPSDETGQWNNRGNIDQSDFSMGTLSMSTNRLLNLDTGVSVVTGLSGAGSNFATWDSVNSVRYFSGAIDNAANPSFGTGLRYGQVYIGFDGSVNTVGKYIRDFAHLAGFTDGDIDIDSALNDQVPGVLLLHPYDLTTLYNDIGVMYDFAYFNSGTKLRFSRNDNSPKKATGTIVINSVPADGDTVTLGTVVYRFKNTPSAPFDVQISGNSDSTHADAKERTLSFLLAAIMTNTTLAAPFDPAAPPYFTGTVLNPLLTAKVTPSSVNNVGYSGLDLTAVQGGLAGNSIVTTKTGTAFTLSAAHLANGAEAPPPVKTVDLNTLAHVSENQLSENDSLVTTILPLGLAQQAAALNYYSLEQNYQLLTQTYIPDDRGGTLDVTGETTVQYTIPFIISTSEAYLRVSKAALAAGENVITQQFRLTQSSMLLEPSDVITVNIAPYSYVVRLDEATFNADFSTSYTAVNYSFRNDIAIGDSDSRSQLPQRVAFPNDCVPVIVDAPLRVPALGTSPGRFDFYDGLRAFVTGFGEGSLSVGLITGGIPASATPLFSTSFDVRWGTFATVPDAVAEPFMLTREDSLDLTAKTILSTDLASADDYVSFVGGQNCLLYGRPGAWEYIFFRDVEVLGPKSYRLTGLIRGQRGTEINCNNHQASDIVFLVASASSGFSDPLRAQTLTVDLAGDVYRYYGTGLPSSRIPGSVDVTVAGLQLYPFAPSHLTATLAGGNDIDLAWVRRDRLNTEFVTNAAALSETLERYDLEILSGGTVVRTVTDLSSPAYVYTSANQVTDGFTPPLATLKVNVYQKSADTGRGFKKSETLNVQ